MSQDNIVRRQSEDIFFLHNCFGSFFSGVLDYFEDEFYQRINYKVIGTYDKAVKFLLDRKQNGTDPNEKLLPAISLDPGLDFSNAEQGGRFLWQHRTLAPGIGMRLFKGIDLKEQDIIITPVFSRYQGTFEITFWFESVYELIDFRVSLLQFVGGFNRWIRPKFFWSYIILPEKIENYENEEGEKIDWSNSYAEIIHVDTFNKHVLGVPFSMNPIWRLTSFGDSSTKNGGGDQLTEWKLIASFEYEVQVPTYIVLSRGLDPTIKMSFGIGKSYTKYPLISPFKVLKSMQSLDVHQEYFSPNYQVYKIKNDIEERSKFILNFNSKVVIYPNKLPSWNYIISGKVIELTLEWLSNSQNVVHKNDIIYIDHYIPEFLPAVRKCIAVISKKDVMSSTLYQKCLILKKPLISYLTDEESNIVKSYSDQFITLDVFNHKMYNGILEVEQVNSCDKVEGYETLMQMKNKNPSMYQEALNNTVESEPFNIVPVDRGGPEYSDKLFKRVLSDRCNGIQKKFYLNFVLDEAHSKNLLVYIDNYFQIEGKDYRLIDNTLIEFFTAPPQGSYVYISGQMIVIRESNLIAIYEFTKEDEESSNPVIVVLENAIDRPEDIILVSYIGKLIEGKDYTVNTDNKTFSITLKPIKNEIVEFFYYT